MGLVELVRYVCECEYWRCDCRDYTVTSQRVRWYQISQLGHVHPLRNYVLIPVNVSLWSRKEMLLQYGHASSRNLRHDCADLVSSHLLPIAVDQLYWYSARTLLLAHGTDHVLLLSFCLRDLRHLSKILLGSKPSKIGWRGRRWGVWRSRSQQWRTSSQRSPKDCRGCGNHHPRQPRQRQG